MTTQTGHTRAIRAKKVIGTAVVDGNGDRIGQIEDIVLDKLSNDIMFAVVGLGGVMGMGEKYHPLPWSVLDYNETEDSYAIPQTKAELQTAPADTMDELTRGDGLAFRDKTYAFYNAQPYW